MHRGQEPLYKLQTPLASGPTVLFPATAHTHTHTHSHTTKPDLQSAPDILGVSLDRQGLGLSCLFDRAHVIMVDCLQAAPTRR